MASYMTGEDPDSELANMEGLLRAGDWRALLAAEQKKKISACGATIIAALMCLAGPGGRMEVLNRASSLEKQQDPERIVHYAAIGFGQ